MTEYDPALKSLAVAALERLKNEISEACPHMAPEVLEWVRGRSDTPEPADYYTHPSAFPTLLFPWWIGRALDPTPHLDFQGEAVYSTVNGYYFVRILDNLMDGNATVETDILPASIFFHTQFLRSYHRYFDHGHPFWKYGLGISFATADAIYKDSSLTVVDEAQFKRISAGKTAAAQIPIAAACFYFQRPDLIASWSRLSKLFSAWSQMFDDIFDCFSDSASGTQTYILSEAARRSRPGETVAEWMSREGLDWGAGLLAEWMLDMEALAREVGSEDVLVYLEERMRAFEERRREVSADLRGLELLATALRGAATA
jgi:hypothetical protein